VGEVMSNEWRQVNYLIKLKGSPIGYLREVLLVSALCLALPALVTSSGVLALGCFFIFEAACGVFAPHHRLCMYSCASLQMSRSSSLWTSHVSVIFDRAQSLQIY